MVFRRDKGVVGQDFLKNPTAPPWVPMLLWGVLQFWEASVCDFHRVWEPMTVVYGLCAEALKKFCGEMNSR